MTKEERVEKAGKIICFVMDLFDVQFYWDYDYDGEMYLDVCEEPDKPTLKVV